MPALGALGRLKQETSELEASLVYMRLCLKKKNKTIQRWRGSLDYDKLLTSHSGKSIYAM
jgi:hypothetical protein